MDSERTLEVGQQLLKMGCCLFVLFLLGLGGVMVALLVFGSLWR